MTKYRRTWVLGRFGLGNGCACPLCEHKYHRWGVLLRTRPWRSFWLGWHYSDNNKRLCINILPFLTVWITGPGGNIP